MSQPQPNQPSKGPPSPRTIARYLGITQKEYEDQMRAQKQQAKTATKSKKQKAVTPAVPNVAANTPKPPAQPVKAPVQPAQQPPKPAQQLPKPASQPNPPAQQLTKAQKKAKKAEAERAALAALGPPPKANRSPTTMSQRDVTIQFNEFLKSSQMKLDLPATLTAADRSLFHRLARKHGITSVSSGEERLGTRALHLTKPPSMQAVQVRANTRARAVHPLQALTGVSMENCLDLKLTKETIGKLYNLFAKHNTVLRWAWLQRKEVVSTTVSDVSVQELQNDYDLEGEDEGDNGIHPHAWTDPDTYYWKPPAKQIPKYKLPAMHPNRPTDLPSFGVRDLFLHCLELNQVVIVAGATGCGKSTQFPQFILDFCRAQNKPCRIVVTQPRRLAAMSLARRVAFERGQTLTEVESEDAGKKDKSRDDDVQKLWTAAKNYAKSGLDQPDTAREVIGEDDSELLDGGAEFEDYPLTAPAPAAQPAQRGSGDVGYVVRHNRGNAAAPIMFCTIGVLLRRLTDNRRTLPRPNNAEEARGRQLKPTDSAYWTHEHSPLVARLRMTLRDTTHIIIDEVHERGKLTDFALCLLKSALYALPQLKLVVMSATINGPLLSTYFGGAPIIEAQGRTFPVSVFHAHDIMQLTGYSETFKADATSIPPPVRSAETQTAGEIMKLIRSAAPIPPTITEKPPGLSNAEPVKKQNPFYCGNGVQYTEAMLKPGFVWQPTATLRELPVPLHSCGDVCACRVARYGLLACAAITTAQKKAPAILNVHVPLIVHLLRWIVDRVETDTQASAPAAEPEETHAVVSSLQSQMASAAYSAVDLPFPLTTSLPDSSYGAGPGSPFFDIPILAATANAISAASTNSVASAEDKLKQLLRSLTLAANPNAEDTSIVPAHNAGDVDSAGEVVLAPVTLTDLDAKNVRELRECALPHGAVLVFLPGWSEIATVTDALAADPVLGDLSRCVVLPLHSAVPLQQQQQAFELPPPGMWKIVLCTNIAETSVTIPDAVYVIDMCTAKIKGYDAANDMATFNVEWVARANAIQRAGRAGRVRPGYCFRLCSESHMASLEQDELPELLRTGLDDVVLQVKTLLHPSSTSNPREKKRRRNDVAEAADEDDQRGYTACFLARALQPPARSHIFSAIQSLQRVGGLDEMERMTRLGQVYQALPLDPRYARMLMWAVSAGVLDAALTVVAISGSNVLAVVGKEQRPKQNEFLDLMSNGTGNDFIALVNIYNAWVGSGRFPHERRYFARNAMLSHNSLVSVGKARRQLFRQISQLPHLRKALSTISVNGGGDMVYLKPQNAQETSHSIERFDYVDAAFNVANDWLSGMGKVTNWKHFSGAPLPLCNCNAYDDHVVGTLLTMALYPSIAVGLPGKRLKITTRLGVNAGLSNRSVVVQKIANPVVVGFSECIHMMGQVIVSGVGVTSPLAMATGMPLMTPSVASRSRALKEGWGHVPQADDVWVQMCAQYILDHTRAANAYDKRSVDANYMLPSENYGGDASNVCMNQCQVLQSNFVGAIENMVERLGTSGGHLRLDAPVGEITVSLFEEVRDGEMKWSLLTAFTPKDADISAQLGTVPAAVPKSNLHSHLLPLPGTTRAEAAKQAAVYLTNVLATPPSVATVSLVDSKPGVSKSAAYYMDDMVAASAPSHVLPMVIMLRTAVAVLSQRAAIGIEMNSPVGFEAGLHRAATALLRDIAIVCGGLDAVKQAQALVNFSEEFPMNTGYESPSDIFW